jgi:hypothetical protein
MTQENRLSPAEIETLSDDIAETAAHIDVATHRLLSQIRAFDQAEGWGDTGALSCAHWLSWRVGLGLGVAREKVRVARALGDLPRIDDALRRGELSYSKTRAMTRVATPENEETLLELALAATAAQLEKICRLYRPLQKDETADHETEDDRRWLRVRHADDGMVRITVSLHPDEAARVLAAVDASAEIRDGEADQVDGLLALVDQAMGDSAEIGRPAVEAVVRVEVDAATLVGKLPDGTGISAETSRRLLCDAGIVALAEDERGNPLALGRKRRTVSTALRRALHARDGGCQFPGCTNHRFTDAHHIEHWLDGGMTNLDNAILLCRRHNGRVCAGAASVEGPGSVWGQVHEFGFTVERGEDGFTTFRDPRGEIVPAGGERDLRRAASIERLRAALAESGIEIDAATNAPRWDGMPPDYSLCIEALSFADGRHP